jgi:hypothetical protein
MMSNQGLFVLNAFGAYRRPKSDSVSSVNTPRMRTGSTHKITVSFRSGTKASVLSLIRGKAAADSLVSRIQGVLPDA